MPEDGSIYTCQLIFEDSVIFNRTVNITVNAPEESGRSIDIRFSSLPQDMLDNFFVDFFGIPPGLTSLAAIVRDNILLFTVFY